MEIKVNKYEDLRIWQLSHELTIEIYNICKSFPQSEKFGLSDQLRRASSSVPANIVEGYYRNSKKEFLRFLFIARGSAGEVTYFILLAKELGYLKNEKYTYLRNLYEKLIASLSALINSLKK